MASQHNLARERFGIEDKVVNTKTVKQPCRREREIHCLTKEIKALNKKYKRGPVDERERIKDLASQLQERQRKVRANKRAQFTKDPIRFTRTLLGEAISGRQTSSREDVEEFLRKTHNDTSRNQALDANPNIHRDYDQKKKKKVNISEPSWKEVQEVVKKTITGSAPGPRGIPYKVYKKCLILLWKNICTVTRYLNAFFEKFSTFLSKCFRISKLSWTFNNELNNDKLGYIDKLIIIFLTCSL